MSIGILLQRGRNQLRRVRAAGGQHSSPALRFPLFWLVRNLHHSRVSPSIQVMAKGIIKQAGTHVLDLDQENGEFLPLPNCCCPERLAAVADTQAAAYKYRDLHLRTR